MGQGSRCKRDHNSSLLGPSRVSVVNCALANPVVAEDPVGDEPRGSDAQWRTATSSARVDQTGSQSREISESLCRAKKHYFQTRTTSKQRWSVFLALGRI